MSKQRRTNNQQQPRGNQAAPGFTTASGWRKLGEVTEDVPVVPLKLPSGAVIKARRIPMDAWISMGKLPRVFLQAYLDAGGDQDTSTEAIEQRAQEAMTRDPQSALEAVVALKRIVTWAVVWPRITEDAQGENEIDPVHIPDQDFFFIVNWATTGAPGVPVPTKGGQTSVAELETFREGRPRREPVGAGDNGQ